jgi:hypothetical protein
MSKPHGTVVRDACLAYAAALRAEVATLSATRQNLLIDATMKNHEIATLRRAISADHADDPAWTIAQIATLAQAHRSDSEMADAHAPPGAYDNAPDYEAVAVARLQEVATLRADLEHERHEKETVTDVAQAYAQWSRARLAAQAEALELERGKGARAFQATVYAFEGKDVPEDLRDHGMVRRALTFRARQAEALETLEQEMRTLAIRRRGMFDASDRDASVMDNWAARLAALRTTAEAT